MIPAATNFRPRVNVPGERPLPPPRAAPEVYCISVTGHVIPKRVIVCIPKSNTRTAIYQSSDVSPNLIVIKQVKL